MLAQESRIILADEPVASLDPAAAGNVLGILRAIARERGIAVLCSLHQTALAQQFADRIVALRAGTVVLDARADTLDAEQVQHIYGTNTERAPVHQAVERQASAPKPDAATSAAACDDRYAHAATWTRAELMDRSVDNPPQTR